jgi:hypothetical protein
MPPNHPPHHPNGSDPAPPSTPPAARIPRPKGRTGRKDKRSRTTPSGDIRVDITERDIAILRLIDKFRLLNAEQLWQALGGDSHPRAFTRRLATLFHAEHGEVLARPPKQFVAGSASQPIIYAVGPRGREILDRLDHLADSSRRTVRVANDRLTLHFLRHETAVAETALAFQLATERQGWSFALALRDEIAAATGLPAAVDIGFRTDLAKRLPLCPDAHIRIDAGDGAQRAYLIEVDLETEPQIRWNLRTTSILRKVIAYWQVSLWRPLPVHGVIFLTTARRRLNNMIDVVRRVDPKHKGSHFFHFALLDHCRIDTHAALFYDALFHSSKIGYDKPRPLFLDTCPTCHQYVDPNNEPHVVLNALPEPLICNPGAPLLPDHLPAGAAPEYAHQECPGLARR